MNEDLALALECAARAAGVVAAGFTADIRPEYKGAVDPVTAVDREAEDTIRLLLGSERPADAVLAEERGGAAWDHPGRVWIIDPLDGTVNFIHRLPHVAVSVALWEDGQPRVGVVHDALAGEVFAATAGGGATASGQPIRVSTVSETERALVATGFPYDRRERAAELAAVVGRVLAEVQGIRRVGSAALDLCHVAAGRYDAYWEYRLQPWDSAAGQLIVTEAGGRITDLAGQTHRPDSPSLLASNGLIHDRLRAVIGGEE